MTVATAERSCVPLTSNDRSSPSRTSQVGAVVIGRNEAKHLPDCITSLRDSVVAIVYVDSGSTDESVHLARSAGCEIIELDTAIPFTAARARNAGLDRLREVVSELTYVQFVDGDCELSAGWIAAATSFADSNTSFAAIFGRLREKFPDASLYNRLCDLEWNTPAGETNACGGIALFRVNALNAVGAFDARVAAGEEPELCVRLRRAGWRINRLPIDMGFHDAEMHRFSQWWRRTARGGWAFINGASMQGASPQRHWLREAVRPWLWAVCIPIAAIFLARFVGSWSFLLLLAYPIIAARAANSARRRGGDRKTSAAFGVLCVIGKWAELQGQLSWLRDKLLGRLPRRKD